MEFPTGIKFIKEMSREELIEEIAQNQRAQLEETELSSLRHIVADFRIKEATKRIHLEAGIKALPGFLGGTVVDEDDE
jgi:hypothetical protein